MGTATKSDTWRRWPVWERMAVSRTYLMIQAYSHFFYWSIGRAFPSYQEREGGLSFSVLTTIFLTTCLHKESCSHETHYVHSVWTIFKLFLLQLHSLNFTRFNYVLFAPKLLNIQYANTMYMYDIQQAQDCHIKFTSNAGIPLEHGFGKSEGIGTHLVSSGICTDQLFANIAMSSV